MKTMTFEERYAKRRLLRDIPNAKKDSPQVVVKFHDRTKKIILRCPFCHSHAEAVLDRRIKDGGGRCYVRCANWNCGATGPRGDNTPEAIYEWDNRGRESLSVDDIYERIRKVRG